MATGRLSVDYPVSMTIWKTLIRIRGLINNSNQNEGHEGREVELGPLVRFGRR